MRVQVGDVRLFFDVQGAKLRPAGPWLDELPTVLIVHTGPGVDHLPYKEHVGPSLAEVAQVVYLDLRGHGHSDTSTPDTWRVETWSSDLRGLVDALGIEQPVLLGAGWGAFVALRYAARWPDDVSKLVLANPNARFVEQRVVAAFDDVGGGEVGEVAVRYFKEPSDQTLGEFLRVCFPYVLGPAMAIDALVRPEWNLGLAVHWSATEMKKLDLRGDLAAIRAPTLIVAGEADPQYPRASIEEVVDGLGDVRVEWYPGARHSVFRDAPDCLRVINEFVAEPVL
jgi:pimeloyl-ACP methyl ester carboxylesterase